MSINTDGTIQQIIKAIQSARKDESKEFVQLKLDKGQLRLLVHPTDFQRISDNQCMQRSIDIAPHSFNDIVGMYVTGCLSICSGESDREIAEKLLDDMNDSVQQ